MSEIALWLGWAVMTVGGVLLTLLLVAFTIDAAWRAWRKARGFFNIIEAAQALEEKRAAAQSQEGNK